MLFDSTTNCMVHFQKAEFDQLYNQKPSNGMAVVGFPQVHMHVHGSYKHCNKNVEHY